MGAADCRCRCENVPKEVNDEVSLGVVNMGIANDEVTTGLLERVQGKWYNMRDGEPIGEIRAQSGMGMLVWDKFLYDHRGSELRSVGMCELEMEMTVDMTAELSPRSGQKGIPRRQVYQADFRDGAEDQQYLKWTDGEIWIRKPVGKMMTQSPS
eukprot:gnl/TRDRNA2_/TRDRNA2_159861_c0_seq1.p1 gnl/TRDRNA2_/TRDRNA2_159861_c0~~gnl/TRDRNA2_/TRDRNA2_159861_c0_seq1.p1  ORF type:complete len:178 (+),score=16.74 gnl/TRDRNA2_/TRDRNA2_159861_c0_seq1:73-534(+)